MPRYLLQRDTIVSDFVIVDVDDPNVLTAGKIDELNPVSRISPTTDFVGAMFWRIPDEVTDVEAAINSVGERPADHELS